MNMSGIILWFKRIVGMDLWIEECLMRIVDRLVVCVDGGWFRVDRCRGWIVVGIVMCGY